MTERTELPAASLSRFSRFLMEIHEMRHAGHALPQISMAKQKSSISLSNSPLKIPGKLERADVRPNFQSYPAVSTGRFLHRKELHGQEELAFPFIGSSSLLTSCDRAYTHDPFSKKPAGRQRCAGSRVKRGGARFMALFKTFHPAALTPVALLLGAGRSHAYAHSLIRTLYKVIPNLVLAAVFRASIYNFQPCSGRQ